MNVNKTAEGPLLISPVRFCHKWTERGYQASNQLNVFPKPSLLPVFTGLLSRVKSNVIGWWELDGYADRPMRCTDSSELMLDEAHLQPLHCFSRPLCFQAVVCYLCYNSAALFVCDSFQVNVTFPKSEVIPNNGWWSPSGGKLFTSCCVTHLMFVLTGCCKSVFYHLLLIQTGTGNSCHRHMQPCHQAQY